MIRFGTPLAFAALPVLVALLFLGRARLRELVLPTLAALALVVALAGPELREEERVANVCVLLDRSPSVTAAMAPSDAEDALASLRAANPGSRFGVVAFASIATVLSPLSEEPIALAPFVGRGELGTRTDVASAMDLALAVLPEGEGSQVVLASDGRITDGLTDAVVAALSARIPISTLPLGRAVADDVALASLEIPARIEIGRPFEVEIGVEALSPGDAVLALYRNGELVSSYPVALKTGRTYFQVLETLLSAGAYTYLAVVRSPGDPIAENDSLSAFAEAGNPAPLLLVSSDASTGVLASLLAASNQAFDMSSSIPPLEKLASYRTALLTGLPLGRLRADEIQTLYSFVADLGGGLLVAEGEAEVREARGGGIEDLLPVSYTIPQQSERASLAVVYVLDRSGSMEERTRSAQGPGSAVVKIDVLRQATVASIQQLEPDARVGVIAFAWDLEWIQRLAPIGDGRALLNELQTLDASGGTDIYYPIVAALDAIEQVPARVKHILVVSDGRTVDDDRDWEGLLARLEAQSDVHLSVIAVGYEPNRQLLDSLAVAGHGSLYLAANSAVIPQVAMEATKSLLRSRFVSEETPVLGPLVDGNLAAIPSIQGYVLTYPRPTAEVLLFSAAKDPVFARWRLGLGRVGVLNTDLTGTWSGSWLSWSRGPLLIETLLDAVEAETWVPHGLRLSVEAGEAGLQVRVEGREADGALANFLDLEAVLLPGGTTVPLTQTNVGFYEGVLPMPAEGAYALRVADRTRDRVVMMPFSVPYSEEYRQTGVDDAALRAIAEATGGRFLAGNALLGSSGASGTRSYRAIHAQVLLASLGLFLLELGRRKLPRRARKQVPRTD